MTEIVFPFLGTAFIVLVVLPACAVLARIGLSASSRFEARGPLHGLGLRYLILTGSSMLPLAWLFSAALHQAESGRGLLVCLFDHEAAALCFEPTLFIATLALACLVPTLREARAARRASVVRSPRTAELQVRIARIVADRKELRLLTDRVDVTEDAVDALRTVGLLGRRVVVDASYAEACTDDELADALGHEAEHVRGFDPLRYLLLSLALAVNPFGRGLLERQALGWLAAREAHCDREAVIRGAEPLGLAEALVRAARPSSRPVVALGSGSAALLKLRVDMLLAFDENRPTRCCHRERSSATTVLALVLLMVALPHRTSTTALDLLHVGTEHVLHLFWN